jgi:hypothetical protein
MQASRVLHGVDVNLKDTLDIDKELEEINSKLKWNEETKRYE